MSTMSRTDSPTPPLLVTDLPADLSALIFRHLYSTVIRDGEENMWQRTSALRVRRLLGHLDVYGMRCMCLR